MNDANDRIDDRIDAEIRRFAAEATDRKAESTPGGHCDPERLAAYRDGGLPPAEEDSIRTHLLACRECGDLLIDLDSWARGELGSDLPAPSEFEIAAAWKGVRTASLFEPGEEPDRSAPSRPAAPPVRTWRRWRGPLALAAAGLLAAVGLSIQSIRISTLRRDLDALSTPTLNAAVGDLSATPERGVAAVASVLSVAADAPLFTLVLAPPANAPEGPVAVEIATEAASSGVPGRLLWAGAGLALNAVDSYTLTLPRRALDGETAIAIRLLDSGSRKPFVVYHLRIVSP